MKLNEAVTALGALAHERRLEIFRLLVPTGSEGVAAGIIADKLSVPKPTLSFHLKELERADVVTSRREGRSIIYAVNVEHYRDLMAYLADDCCAGRDEYCVPKNVIGGENAINFAQ